MEPIPAPQVLDPDRVSRDDREDMTREDHRSQGQLLAKALDETCEYAQQLWNDLAAMRQYLHDSLPPEPNDERVAGGAAPEGPDDDDGWQRWQDAFAGVTSVLCGPHGDNGFGRSSALLLARSRRVRSAPAPRTERSSSDDDDSNPEKTDAAVAAPDPVRDEPAVAARDRSTLSALVGPLAYGGVGAFVAAVALRRRTGAR